MIAISESSFGIERVNVAKNADIIEAVITGKADAGFSNYAPESMQNMLISDLKFIYFEYLPPVGFARIGIRKDKPILASILNKAVVSLTQNELNDIYKKWLAIELPSPRQDHNPRE